MMSAPVLRALLAIIVVSGIFFGIISPWLNGEGKAEKRKKALQGASTSSRKSQERGADPTHRRKQLSESLKEVESRGKRRRASLEMRLDQAGVKMTKKQFFLISAASGCFFGLMFLVFAHSPLFGLAGLLIGAFGPPNWYVIFRRRRRRAAFIAEFPNAIDIIVRGVRAGLPLGDCLRVIANEAAEPVKSEFRQVIEHQAMGLTVGEAIEKLPDRVPCSETNFFTIAIMIQQKAGGNLSETLGNLSKILRDRKKMKAKIKAMSSEAKASAGIIGSLPFLVTFFVYLTSPGYISLLWTTNTGIMVLCIAGLWMSLGVFVMQKMVSFDF